MTLNIMGLSGSVRDGSYHAALIKAAAEVAPDGVSVSLGKIDDLPMYIEGGSIDEGPVKRFRDEAYAADAFIVAAPEYNHGLTPLLKNALDWGSAPAYASPFAYKAAFVCGASTGMIGGARAQGVLRQVLFALVCVPMPAPDFLVSNAQTKFDAAGRLVDLETRELLGIRMAQLQRFHAALSQFEP